MTPLPIDQHFDEPFANQIAQLEAYNKHHYRPNTYLHKWWARRCGSTFRLILKHLVTDEAQQDYYAAGGLAGKVVLDPMMGGGTTLHEAIRLGASVMGADLDPIPVLQARATLSQLPLLQLEQGFRQFYGTLRAELEPFFLTECPRTRAAVPLWYTLYGLRRACDCGEILVVNSLVLRQETDGSSIRLCAKCGAVVAGDAVCGCEAGQRPLLVPKKQTTCDTCGQTYAELLDVPYYQRYRPLVIVGYSPDRRLFFKAVDEADGARLAEADALRDRLPLRRADFAVDRGRKSVQLHQRGVDNYLDLYSSRQLLYLDRAIAQLRSLPDLVQLNLGLLVSTSLEFNTMLCGYKGKSKRRSGAIRHTFAHHAYAFPYTALENNPLHPRKASGTLQKLFQARIRNGRLWAQQPRERLVTEQKSTFQPIAGEVDSGVEQADVAVLRAGERRFWLRQGSSIALPVPNGFVDFIVTDPPYYDSVQYSDLSNFFRVWLRRLLPDAADWAVDVAESAVDPHKLDRESRYRELMTAIFVECGRVLNAENGRLIFTFHHWNPKAWIALTLALRTAGFRLVNRYVVFSENPISVHINNMKSLLHDVVLVLALESDKAWPLVTAVDLEDSEQFCRDCGSLLGWALQAPLDEAQLTEMWLESLNKT